MTVFSEVFENNPVVGLMYPELKLLQSLQFGVSNCFSFLFHVFNKLLFKLFTAHEAPDATIVGFTATIGPRNLTNIGAFETIVFDSITSNIGFGYSVATGIFRAPVA